MGMAAISVMSWPPMRTARLVFQARAAALRARHGSAIFDPFAALGDFAQAVARADKRLRDY